jgi:hypothetical protein
MFARLVRSKCRRGSAVSGTDCIREEESHMSSMWDQSIVLRDERRCRTGMSVTICDSAVAVRDYTVSEWGGGGPRGDVDDTEWVRIRWRVGRPSRVCTMGEKVSYKADLGSVDEQWNSSGDPHSTPSIG